MFAASSDSSFKNWGNARWSLQSVIEKPIFELDLSAMERIKTAGLALVKWVGMVWARLLSSNGLSELSRAGILAALMCVLILPVYIMTYSIQFTDLASANTWRTELLYYYGRTDSHDKIWGILAPLLVAISVGSNFSNAISTRTVLLFLFFLVSYLVADIGAVTLEADPDLQRVLKARNNVDIENVRLYFASVGTMCTTAIATVLGLSASKIGA